MANLFWVEYITNRKGGCGKSFTTASLGVGLARQGKRVLLIDADNQHSLTVSMGVTKPDTLSVSLTTVITEIIAKNNIDPMAGIIHHSEGIDLMPANDSLTSCAAHGTGNYLTEIYQ